MKRITYLIDKFWNRTATVEERRELLDYLKNQHIELKEQLEQEFQLLKDEFSDTPLSETRASELFQSIRQTAGIHDTKSDISIFRRIRPLIQFSAAAVILFFMAWSAYRIFRVTSYSDISSQENIALSTDSTYHSNEGGQAQKIALEDGSVVTLYPQSTLSYPTHFEQHARNLHLHGLAKFEVAKDPSRPFNVLANGYTTTALGTVFTINTNRTDMVKVHLLSGKVVVRSTATALLALADTYLQPGDELAIDLSNSQWAVHNSHISPSQPKNIESSIDTDNNEYLVFNKTPLEDVFAQIGKKYGYSIDCKEIDLSHLSFTGSFKQTESLYTIMNIICSMNDLEYHKEAQKLRISRK